MTTKKNKKLTWSAYGIPRKNLKSSRIEDEECLIFCGGKKVLSCKKASDTFIHGKHIFGDRSVGVMFMSTIDLKSNCMNNIEPVQVLCSLIFVFLSNIKQSYF